MPVHMDKVWGEKKTFWQVLTSEKYYRWLLISPLLLTLAVFMLYPTFFSLYYSTTEYILVRPAEFIGLENFRQVLTDVAFWTALGRTAQVLVISIAFELTFGIALAILWTRKFKGENVVRGLCLLPLLIMPLAMSMMWGFITQYNFGAVNQILYWFGIERIMWWSQTRALFVITFMSIWQWTPFSIFVLLAGLRGLPRDVFEAVRVDGASAWYTFRRVTLPMLMPLILIIILLRTMWLIRVFDPIYGTTQGGVNTEVLDFLVFRIAFIRFDIGIGTTMALISLFLTIVFSAVLFRYLMKALGVTK